MRNAGVVVLIGSLSAAVAWAFAFLGGRLPVDEPVPGAEQVRALRKTLKRTAPWYAMTAIALFVVGAAMYAVN